MWRLSAYNMNMKMSEADLREEILSDKYNAIAFDAASGSVIYLVGGYLRDVLIGRKCRDRDYVASGRFENILERVASQTGARAFQIGGKGLYRFVLKNGVSMDFSRLGDDISADVLQRDFTVNAMAWSPTSGLTDICAGRDDLARGTIRMISAENIMNDPVRMVRAYRLAQELSFTIERKTRTAFRLLAGLIKGVKTERITLEFFKVLNAPNPLGTLRMLRQDGILGCIIDCSHDDLGDKLKVISGINRIFKELPLKYRSSLHHIYSENLSFGGLLRLEVLLKGRPENMLCLSSRVLKRLRNLEASDALLTRQKSISKKTLFEVFERAKESAMDFLVTRNHLAFLPDYERYQAIKARKILSAQEINQILCLREGIILGRILRELERARFAGLINDRADALGMLRRIYLDRI
jgi:tRNA nucleotidyltransferase/poly(A) polymerase